MGLGKCKRTVKENLANGGALVTNGNNGGTEDYESDDNEVSFSPRSGDLSSDQIRSSDRQIHRFQNLSPLSGVKESTDIVESDRPDRKRKRVEIQHLTKVLL